MSKLRDFFSFLKTSFKRLCRIYDLATADVPLDKLVLNAKRNIWSQLFILSSFELRLSICFKLSRSINSLNFHQCFCSFNGHEAGAKWYANPNWAICHKLLPKFMTKETFFCFIRTFILSTFQYDGWHLIFKCSRLILNPYFNIKQYLNNCDFYEDFAVWFSFYCHLNERFKLQLLDFKEQIFAFVGSVKNPLQSIGR